MQAISISPAVFFSFALMHSICTCFSSTLLSVLLAGSLSAQPRDYPQGYFRNPLGIPILLAGNFGECRPGHFHSGMDIKTAGVENLPVYAAADGYISRIKMEPGGFGHGLYITHPNGYTTLYAHLNNFIPAIQEYVRSKQYAALSWTVDLTFKPDQFPVQKGDQIAWSGNTGGSTAPHLHFEIRDSRTEHPLNPQLFGFEVKDTKAPVPLKLALYNRAKSIYLDEPVMVPLKKGTGNNYRPIRDTIMVNELAGLGIEVNDFMEGSENTLAFYTAEWFLDGLLQGRIRLDNIGYDETRYLHAYADYKTRQSGPWIQCLFRLNGNGLTRIYEQLNSYAGAMEITGNKVHSAEIRLTDASGNIATVRCHLKRTAQQALTLCNDLTDASKGSNADRPDLRYTIDGKVLYEDACALMLNYPHLDGGVSARHDILSPVIPAHHSFPLSIKSTTGIPFNMRNKVALIYSDGKKQSGQAATGEDKGLYGAKVRAFGEYHLEIDTAAPVITPTVPVKGNLGKAKRISFTVKDGITSVKTFRGELDGAWILFEQHENIWFYEMEEHCPKGAHKLIVKAADENGNTRTQTYTFTR